MTVFGVPKCLLMMVMLVYAAAAAADHVNKAVLLKDILKVVLELKNQSEIQNMSLPKINNECPPSFFCKAEEALKELNLPKNVNKKNLETLHRYLHQYNHLVPIEHSKCAPNVNHTFKVAAFLKEMRHCVIKALNKTTH
ncbi:hypothetical protein FQA47_004791 [Oryzias melastigma]|uniref:Interleukin-4 n=1 Tax=Oryzias melastigma TaxID=30732 RepID=A0A834FED2_ORYME|nr:hypothetical protein FQA47_004791 [Oryzias melastigma]